MLVGGFTFIFCVDMDCDAARPVRGGIVRDLW